MAVIESIVFVLGWIMVYKLCIKMFTYGYALWFCKGHDIVKRYGHRSWALVTGSTDGIGMCFSQQLAKRGYNVIVSGRTAEKVEKRVKELENAYPKVQVKGIVVDFSKCDQPGFIDNIRKKLIGLDISLLVNNVSTIRYENVGDLTDENIIYTVKLNCINHALLLNHFLPYFKRRGVRSAIIDVCSLHSLRPYGKLELQSAIKAYNRALTLSVKLAENYTNVDMLCLMPGWTKTNMLPDLKMTPINALPEDVVNGALRDLGYFKESFGAHKHYLNGIIMELCEFLLPFPWGDKAIKVIENKLRTMETKN